jgi:hypothetical protein
MPDVILLRMRMVIRFRLAVIFKYSVLQQQFVPARSSTVDEKGNNFIAVSSQTMVVRSIPNLYCLCCLNIKICSVLVLTKLRRFSVNLGPVHTLFAL